MEEESGEIIEKKEDNSESIIEDRRGKLRFKLFGWVEDNYDKVFLAVLIFAFILRLLIFFKTLNQPLWWDAATYMTTAKKWGLGLDINTVWYFRRAFLWPLIGAILFKFGFGETGVRFAEVLFSTGIVFVSYFLIKDMFNKKYALFASLGLALSWVILFFTGRPLTSIPATFFLLTSLLFFWKGYELKQGNKFIYLFGLFYALSILVRMQYLMFAPVFLIFLFVKEKLNFLKSKHFWIAIGIFFLVLLPHLIIYTIHYGNPITDIASHYFGVGVTPAEGTQKVQSISKIFMYFLDLPYILTGDNLKGVSYFGSLSRTLSWGLFLFFLIGVLSFFLELFLGFDKIFQNRNIQKKLFIFLWIIAPFLFLGYMMRIVEQRYVMPTFPFLFLIVSWGLFSIGNLTFKKLNKNNLGILIFIIFLLLLIPNYTFGNSLIDSKKISYKEVMDSGIWIKENSNPTDIVVSQSFPQTSYYSERSVYNFDEEGDPESKITRDEEGFNSFVEREKPRYLILSAFEKHPEWAYRYPEKNMDKLITVKVYEQEGKPLLVIYEFKPWESKISSINETFPLI